MPNAKAVTVKSRITSSQNVEVYAPIVVATASNACPRTASSKKIEPVFGLHVRQAIDTLRGTTKK